MSRPTRSERENRSPHAGFFVRANSTLGFGHLSRAVSIAREGRQRNWRIRFFSEDDLRISKLFHDDRFDFVRLRSPEDLAGHAEHDRLSTLVVDVPTRDERLLAEWKERVGELVVVDDGDADCPLADVLVNGHVFWGDRKTVRRNGQVRCLGTRFMLLSREWLNARKRYSLRNRVRRILVTFGGSDPSDLSGKVVPRLAQDLPDTSLTVILGPGYRGSFTSDETRGGRVQVVRNVGSLVPFALESDVAVCAVGVTMYELAAVGVPMVLVDEDPTHELYMRAMAKERLALWSGHAAEVPALVARLVRSGKLRRQMSSNGRRKVDGGGAARIAAQIAARGSKGSSQSSLRAG